MTTPTADTNYGLLFDVRAVPEPENLAYSDRRLKDYSELLRSLATRRS